MGIARPKDLADLIRLEANLKVECPSCGRGGVFPVRDVIAYFRNRGWNTAWLAAGEHFRCDGLPPEEGCGHRGALLSLVPAVRPQVAPLPQPTHVDRKKQARRERG